MKPYLFSILHGCTVHRYTFAVHNISGENRPVTFSDLKTDKLLPVVLVYAVVENIRP